MLRQRFDIARALRAGRTAGDAPNPAPPAAGGGGASSAALGETSVGEATPRAVKPAPASWLRDDQTESRQTY